MRPCWHELDDETPHLLDLALAKGMKQALDALQRAHQGYVPPVLVVAVSGGVDSVCLLYMLWCSAKQSGMHLHVAHLDHGLRLESAEDAAFVEQLAAEMGLPFHSERAAIYTGSNSGGLEAAARRARYGFLARVARAVTPPGKTPCVLTAHHADDQAETVLLNLARSDGYKGIRGMDFCSAMPEQGRGRRVYLLRPLLQVRRNELMEYARTQELTWREDFTNAIPDRPRARLRHNVLPELERINRNAVMHLAGAALWAHVEMQFIRSAWDMIGRLVLISEAPGERVVLSWEQLQKLTPEQQSSTLERILRRTMLLERRWWSLEDVAPIAHRLKEPVRAGGPYVLAGPFVWTVLPASNFHPARLVLHRNDILPTEADTPWLDDHWRATVGSLPLLVPGCTPVGAYQLEATLLPAPLDLTPASPWEATLDRAAAGEPVLTCARPGMRIAPLGMAGQSRALGDIFTDKKVPPALREGWPVIIDARTARVLWLCGLVRSHTAAVKPTTTTALRLRWVAGNPEEVP